MNIQHYITINGETRRIKDRVAAILIAAIAGWFGLHKFYLGRIGAGVLFLLFCWTVIPLIIGIIEAVIFFFMTEEEFDAKYNS